MSSKPKPIYINVLGDLEVTVSGNPAPLPNSRKTRALLAYLAMSNRPQRRDRLCEIFWDIPDDPRGSLRWSLSKIRVALRVAEHDPIVADRHTVQIDKTMVDIDFDQLKNMKGTDPAEHLTAHLSSVASLFRGPFLGDLSVPRCPEFEAWRIAHLNQTELLQIKVLRELVARSSGEPEAALVYLASLSALCPDDESLIGHMARIRNDAALSGRDDGPPGPAVAAIDATSAAKSPVRESSLPSIGVLPFDNISQDPDHDYFADGITEDIIATLSRIRWLFIIARNTMFTFKGQPIDVQKIARELGLDYVLEGSVRRAGDQVRITAKLIDGETGNHIWSDRYDRQLTDLFAVQDEITSHIVGALEPQMVAAESQRSHRKPEQILDAWDLVIRAMAKSREFTDRASTEALALLERALAIDGNYARAHSQKAWMIAWRIHQGWEDADSALSKAINAAEIAVQSDPDEPWAYIGWLFISTITRDGERMIASANRAVELSPNFAMANSWLGAAYALAGRGAEAFEWIEKARRLSPRDIFKAEFDVHTSYAYFQVADYEAAAEFASRASLPRPHHVYPRLMRAASLAHLGRQEAASAEAGHITALAPQFDLSTAERVCVFIADDDRRRFVDGLRLAGLPE